MKVDELIDILALETGPDSPERQKECVCKRGPRSHAVSFLSIMVWLCDDCVQGLKDVGNRVKHVRQPVFEEPQPTGEN